MDKILSPITHCGSHPGPTACEPRETPISHIAPTTRKNYDIGATLKPEINQTKKPFTRHSKRTHDGGEQLRAIRGVHSINYRPC